MWPLGFPFKYINCPETLLTEWRLPSAASCPSWMWKMAKLLEKQAMQSKGNANRSCTIHLNGCSFPSNGVSICGLVLCTEHAHSQLLTLLSAMCASAMHREYLAQTYDLQIWILLPNPRRHSKFTGTLIMHMTFRIFRKVCYKPLPHYH